MAKSKKIIGFTGTATEISLPSRIAEGIVNNIKSDVFSGKGVTKIIVNNSSKVAPAGAPWGAAGATIVYTDKTVTIYSITTTLTNVTAQAGNPTTIESDGTATLVFTANSGYTLPDSVTVTGATHTWNKTTGTLNLSAPTGAVSITISGAKPIVKLPVGGRIFYVHNDNGATYKFWDASDNELTTQTVAGLATASTYAVVSGTPTADKFYVYNNELTAYKQWGKMGTLFRVNANTIGSGKPNSATCLAATDWESNSIWAYINTIRTNQVGGCNDWYIGSKAEQNKLRTSGLVNWYSNNAIWSSVETDENFGTLWIYFASDWDFNTKDSVCAACFGVRSF